MRLGEARLPKQKSALEAKAKCSAMALAPPSSASSSSIMTVHIAMWRVGDGLDGATKAAVSEACRLSRFYH